MRNSIYVQIPSYRDKELLPTVQSMTRMAKRADRLRIAIAWQYGENEDDVEALLRQCGHVELVKIPASQSQGCNWARSLLQNRWDGEKYTLFVDSHHRFVPAWDEEIVGLLEERRAAGVGKPIITAYLPPYIPGTDPEGRTMALFKIQVRERREGMLFRLIGHPIRQWEDLLVPVPAHFTSLHFLFADGSFNHEVPFDPSIYFFTDEVAIALRAFTYGYDLFHPHRILGWHLYDRSTRVTHWSDHAEWR